MSNSASNQSTSMPNQATPADQAAPADAGVNRESQQQKDVEAALGKIAAQLKDAEDALAEIAKNGHKVANENLGLFKRLLQSILRTMSRMANFISGRGGPNQYDAAAQRVASAKSSAEASKAVAEVPNSNGFDAQKLNEADAAKQDGATPKDRANAKNTAQSAGAAVAPKSTQDPQEVKTSESLKGQADDLVRASRIKSPLLALLALSDHKSGPSTDMIRASALQCFADEIVAMRSKSNALLAQMREVVQSIEPMQEDLLALAKIEHFETIAKNAQLPALSQLCLMFRDQATETDKQLAMAQDLYKMAWASMVPLASVQGALNAIWSDSEQAQLLEAFAKADPQTVTQRSALSDAAANMVFPPLSIDEVHAETVDALARQAGVIVQPSDAAQVQQAPVPETEYSQELTVAVAA